MISIKNPKKGWRVKMAYCKKCGYILKDVALFCSHCGTNRKENDFSNVDFKKDDQSGITANKKKAPSKLKLFLKRNISQATNIMHNPDYIKPGLSPYKEIFRLVIFVVSIISIWYSYRFVSESYDIKKYSDAGNVAALTDIVKNYSGDSKKAKAINALIKMKQPDSLLAIEDLLGNNLAKNIEKEIWVELIETKTELPSGINILSKGHFSQKELIKQYFFSLSSGESSVSNVKDLIRELAEEENGYEKISVVLTNAEKMLETSNEKDKILFKKIADINGIWRMTENNQKDSIKEQEELRAQVNSSSSIINANLEKMQGLIMQGYYSQNDIATKSLYADQATRNMMYNALQEMDAIARSAIEITANGDVKRKASIYTDIAKNMGKNIYQEVYSLGVQVVSEADKIKKANTRIANLSESIGETSMMGSWGLKMEYILLSEESTEVNVPKLNELYKIPETKKFDIDMLNNGSKYTVEISEVEGAPELRRKIIINNNLGSEWSYIIYGPYIPSCSVAFLRDSNKPDLIFTNKFVTGYLNILIIGASNDGNIVKLFDQRELESNSNFEKIRLDGIPLLSLKGLSLSNDLDYNIRIKKNNSESISFKTYMLSLSWDSNKNKFEQKIW